MAAFINLTFSGTLDSRGRITVPARIRNRLGLGDGDTLSLQLNSRDVVRKEFSDEQEAIRFVSSLEDVKSFSFDGQMLEVIING